MMTQHDPLASEQPTDGLSPAELESQEIAELPSREAMSLVNPDPASHLISPDPFQTVPTDKLPDGLEPGMNRPIYETQ